MGGDKPAAPVRQKKRRWGWFLTVIAFVALIGAFSWFFPQQAAQSWRFLSSVAGWAPDNTADTLSRQVRQLTQQVQSITQQQAAQATVGDDVKQTIERLEAKVAAHAARTIEQPTAQGGLTIEDELRIVALNLQLTGNPKVAARRLRQLAESPRVSVQVSRQLQAEAWRLDSLPARKRLLDVLERILQDIQPQIVSVAAQVPDEALVTRMAQLFQLRREYRTDDYAHERDLVRQLILYLATGLYDRYWRTLQDVVMQDQLSDATRSGLQALVAYGKPDYHLSVP